MGDKKEQIKQEIVLELEHARLWGSLLVPLFGMVLLLFFTNTYFADNRFAQILFGAFGVVVGFALILLRNECIIRIHKRIKEL